MMTLRSLGIALTLLCVSPAAALADCTCRAQGRNVEMGETICLATHNGPRLATCEMVLNNSSWKISNTSCAISTRIDRKPARSHAHLKTADQK